CPSYPSFQGDPAETHPASKHGPTPFCVSCASYARAGAASVGENAATVEIGCFYLWTWSYQEHKPGIFETRIAGVLVHQCLWPSSTWNPCRPERPKVSCSSSCVPPAGSVGSTSGGLTFAG